MTTALHDTGRVTWRSAITAPFRRGSSDASASLSLADGKQTAPKGETGSNSVSYRATGALVDPEYRYELTGIQGGRTYQRMRFSDPHIAGLRAAQNLPLLQANAKVLPADQNDKDAVAKAELVERLLLRDFPWRSFLQDTLLALDYGFACFEVVWRIENGEARCRLALRPASSIYPQNVYVKDGAIEKVTQQPLDGTAVDIPGERVLWFAHQKEGDQFTGRPVLRAMYKPWKIKEELEIELPIMVRKLGGVPDIATESEPTGEEAALLDEAGAKFGLAPDAYFRHLKSTEVTLLTGNANVKDVLDAIQQRNTEITAVCQAQVFDLGTSNAGSRALGSTLSDLFNNGIMAVAKMREDVLNAAGGLVHQLVAYNFPRDDNLPRLQFGNVQQVDLLRFAQALVAFNTAFAGLDPETEEWAREEADMPTSTTAQVVVPGEAPQDAKPEPSAPASSKSQGPGADAAGGSGPESGAKAAESGCCHGLQLAETRQPRGVECYVQLAEIAARFDDAKTAVADATQRVRDRLVGELVSRAQAAQAKGKLSAFVAQAPPMVDALKSAILPVLRDNFEAGRAQVADELRRQREGDPVVAEVLEARQDGQRVMAAEKPKKPAPPLPDPDEAMEDAAEMAARTIAERAKAASALAAARTGSGVPLDPAAAAEAVTREADAAALRMVGVVSDLMSLGRATQAAEQAQDIETCVYSAILDGALCENCEPMDGQETTDLGEAAGWAPNPDCLGGDRCRCLVVYELRQEAAA